jgi:drug/metabolite transporter (DMT)-like permease
VIAGSIAALSSAGLWAFASTRYALASRTVGSARVNLARATTVLPVFLVTSLWSTGGHLGAGVTGARAAWLLLSVLCAYAFADNVFFAAARRVGITTALAIASSYPLWAAFAGALWRGEPFGPGRILGTLLCVGGVVVLIVQAPQAADEHEHKRSTRREAREGILLALATSVLWAGNSLATKMGGTGMLAWHANLIRFSWSWIILAGTAAMTQPPVPDRRIHWPIYRALIPVSLAEACVGSSLYVYGLANTDLAVGATLTSLAPLMSVPVALFYREERWSARRFGAVAATVVGVVLLVLA